ncbi:MAG: glycosyltransferase family 2 protein [Hyphomicrobiaceae bacterium]
MTFDSERVRGELASVLGQSTTVGGRSIAVLLPCYNEEVAVGGTVDAFRKALPGARIYVYDNNSTDRTAEVARAAGAIVRHERWQGKGNVVRRMLADIDADIYVLADGDMTYDATAAGRMIDLLVTNNLDMVVGTRVPDDAGAAFRNGHQFGNRLFNRIVQRLFGTQFTDILSGYRVLSRRFAKSFPAASSGFEIETEFSVHALDLRLSTAEVPVRYLARPALSHSKLRTYSDGLRISIMIANMFRWLKPREFYGAIGAMLAVLSLAAGVPVVIEFLQTGLVPRLPTALLAAALGQLAVLVFACGLILEAVSRGQRELRRMRYLDLTAPALQPDEAAVMTAKPETPTATTASVRTARA